MPHVKSKGFSKKTKVGMGVVLVVVAFFILVVVSGSPNQQQNVQETSVSEKFIDKPLTEILPVRNDITTEWIIGTTEDLHREEKGFIEGTAQWYTKGGIFSTSVSTSVLRFDSFDNAFQVYNEKILSIKQEGGYKEFSTGSVDATCYGIHKEGLLSDRVEIRCYKNNIYFTIGGNGDVYEIEDDTKNMAKIIARKIN